MTLDLLQNLHVLDSARQSGGGLLVVLDFDGTLTPISESPAEVRLPFDATVALAQLISTKDVTVAIVSGRALGDLARRIPFKGVTLAGNHGLEIRAPDWSFMHPEATLLRPVLQQACAEIMPIVEEVQGAWIEDKGLTATVHYRNTKASDRELLLSRVHSSTKLRTELCLRNGKMAVEIYPNVPWNKGCAVQLIRCRTGLDSARCVVFGDDETDESMFRRLSEEVTVCVGQNDLSSARYHLRDPGEVQIALEFLADFMRPGEFHCDHLRRPFTAESAWMRRA